MHTPGPWKWTGSMVAVPSGVILLVNGVSLPCGNHPDNDEASANSRLIAAAPDLLAACLGIIDMLGPDAHSYKVGEMAKAAISKALEGQP